MGNCLGCFTTRLRPRPSRAAPPVQQDVELSSSTTSLRSRSEEHSSTNEAGNEFEGTAGAGPITPVARGTDHITTSGSPETLQTEGPAEGEIAGTETVSGELNTEGRDGDAAAIGGESATNGDAGGSGGETGN